MTAPLTPERRAALQAAAFDGAARWSEEAIAGIAEGRGGILVEEAGGFALGRAVAGEAELLTLVVDGAMRRRGTGRALLARFEIAAREQDATEAFLEVAADNLAARALYQGAGWAQVGHRAGYYAGTDALLLRKSL